MDFKTTGRARVQSVKCCVLFDPADGEILHTHRVVTMDGAAEVSEREVEKRTLELAKGFGLKVAKLRSLHVDAGAFEAGKRYAVDPKSKRLVAVAAARGERGAGTTIRKRRAG